MAFLNGIGNDRKAEIFQKLWKERNPLFLKILNLPPNEDGILPITKLNWIHENTKITLWDLSMRYLNLISDINLNNIEEF